jgi:hypothetical protein
VKYRKTPVFLGSSGSVSLDRPSLLGKKGVLDQVLVTAAHQKKTEGQQKELGDQTASPSL